MVNVRNYPSRYNNSYLYGRQNINNRYQRNAYRAAFDYQFFNYQPSNISYTYNSSNSQVVGYAIGATTNFLVNNWNTVAKIGSWAGKGIASGAKAVGNFFSNMWSKCFG